MYFVDKINQMVKENGFMSVMIVGRQGVGKTTYAMRTLYHYYGDWDKVLDSMTFDPVGLLRRRKHYDVILIDDAGVHLSKYDWRNKNDFSKFFNLIRDVTNFLIFTTPNESDILKNVRDKLTYLVNIHGHVRPRIVDRGGKKYYAGDEYCSDCGYARIYKRKLVINYSTNYKPDYRYECVMHFDEFLYKIPEDIRKRYAEMRSKITQQLLDELVGKPTTVNYEVLIERLKQKAKLYYDKTNDSYKLKIDGMITLPRDIAESVFSGLRNNVSESLK
nr:hypothetical protein [Sulfolobus islandicus]